MPHKSYRQESKADWGVNTSENYIMNDEQLKLGALLRIADATELMAKNYQQLQDDVLFYKRKLAEVRAREDRMLRRISAYKGIIRKLKAKK